MNASTEIADKTLSPYFFIISNLPDTDQLPLKSTAIQVRIAGVIADVKVIQEYKNEGNQPLEAIYIFPASINAAVYGMKMTIGERVIVAKIKERKKARQEYEQAKEAGKSASLLEQQRPNLFQMNVANILPGDMIQVELSYTELLIPTDGVYEFIYPTVVGPRYSEQSKATAPQSEQWVENPYLHEGESSTYTFDITATLASGMPIQDMTVSSHKVNITFNGTSLATVNLDETEKFGGNRDYILKYRLAGNHIESGLLLYESPALATDEFQNKEESVEPPLLAKKEAGKIQENFFLLMAQPPEQVTEAQIPPREYIFIMDVSGSMEGFPIDISKNLLKELIQQLRQTDMFNLVLFSHNINLFSKESLHATTENVDHAFEEIDRQFGGGGTRIFFALKEALSLPKKEGFSRSIVIATDGYVDIEKETFDYIRHHLGDANIFPFGIGSSTNRYLIEGIARVGMSVPIVITKPEEANAKVRQFFQYIQYPVLTNIRAHIDEFDIYDVEPISIPDMLAKRPVILFGKWRGMLKGKIRVTGISGEGDYVKEIDISQVQPLDANAALPYLWARHKLVLLSDYNMVQTTHDNIRVITELGLTYNLLTDYTSFVAIDNMVRRENDEYSTIRQPLPLPDKVSDKAVGSTDGLRLYHKKAIVHKASAISETDFLKTDFIEDLKFNPESDKIEEELMDDFDLDLRLDEPDELAEGAAKAVEVTIAGKPSEPEEDSDDDLEDITLDDLGDLEIEEEASDSFEERKDTIEIEIDEIDKEMQTFAEDETELEFTDERSASVVRFINKIIIYAYEKNASDIHIQPQPGKKNIRIRIRIDGVCQEFRFPVPYTYKYAIVSRIKAMAGLDIRESREPQHGKIRFKKYGNLDIDLRVATIPIYGEMETVVMRILTPAEVIPLIKLGLSEHNSKAFLELITKPYGLILITGPPGSGKTTTLHSVLNYLNKPEVNIWTMEEPVEFVQQGLNQIEIQSKTGFTYDKAIRSVLKADPDIIMAERAFSAGYFQAEEKDFTRIAIEAALTGHLVLSSLRTANASGITNKLFDTGLDPYNFADAFLGALAQRLIRTLCKYCKEAYTPSKDEYKYLIQEYGGEEVWENYVNIPYSKKLTLYRAKGCGKCNHTGYRGRMAIHEVFITTSKQKKLIQLQALTDEIQKQAIADGMRTLKQDGIEKVFAGHFDLSSVKRIMR